MAVRNGTGFIPTTWVVFDKVVCCTTMESVSVSDVKLFNSSASGDKEGVIAALAQGGRVTVRNPQGLTPFLIASLKGHMDICGLLVALIF